VADDHRQLNNAAERGIPRYRHLDLIRHLAAEDVTRAALAREHGVHRSAITQFAQRHRAEIEQIRTQLDDEYAGIWLADKRARLAALQSDYEMAAEHKNAGHHEWIKTRAQLLHQASEELGQLPGRVGVVVVPVTHILVGVDAEALT